MAGSFNRVFLMGNLTRDVEVRHLPNSNTAVAAIGLAVNRRFRTADGENREEVTFVDCEAFGRTAETMSQYLRKGRPVFIEGRLKLDQWEDKEGGKRSKLKVIVETFQFVDSREGGGDRAPEGDDRPARGGGRGGAPSGGGGGAGRSGGGGGGGGGSNYEPVSEDEIPF